MYTVKDKITAIDDNIQLIVVNDIWHSRNKVVYFIKENKNVEEVLAVRLNTVLYDKLTTSKGCRGMPALKGKKLILKKILNYTTYLIQHILLGKIVKTRLFGLDLTAQGERQPLEKKLLLAVFLIQHLQQNSME